MRELASSALLERFLLFLYETFMSETIFPGCGSACPASCGRLRLLLAAPAGGGRCGEPRAGRSRSVGGDSSKLQARTGPTGRRSLSRRRRRSTASGMLFEGEADLEMALMDRQFQIDLQHDGHFAEMFLAQALGELHALMAVIDRDENGGPRAGRSARRAAGPAGQPASKPPAPGGGSSDLRPCRPPQNRIPKPQYTPEMKVQASVARCLRTPPRPAKAEGLDFGLSHCITQREQPEHSCHLQLYDWPDNGGTIPSKSPSFTPSSILFHPQQARPRMRGSWWRCRVLPPGPMGLLRWPFIAIAALAGRHHNIGEPTPN